MNEFKTVRWKYLRETDKRYFDPSRNTSLKDYLDFIFPDYTFVYDTYLTKDVVLSRNPNAENRRFRPDARCEERNLIIEFDGTSHYQDQTVVLSDLAKDEYLRSLGYTVVRIPYWIQLSQEVIIHMFGVDPKDAMCQLPCSFYDPVKHDPCISICPGSMSEAGRDRFVEEFNAYPESVRNQIMDDLEHCINHLPEGVPSRYVLPQDVRNRLNI